jgi:hypothetical protein
LEINLNQEQIPLNTEREAFVLRLWRETPGNQNWRGQLQHVRTGEVIAFQDVEELFDYIRQKIELPASTERNSPELEGGLR